LAQTERHPFAVEVYGDPRETLPGFAERSFALVFGADQYRDSFLVAARASVVL
jgi:hypothetical protein